jgi:hypothetical protein
MTRLAALLIVATLTLYVGGSYVKTLGLRTINPSAPEREIYEFVASLPKDVLVVGEPELMMGIPLYARRRVMFSALHPDVGAPILDFFDAQYAESPEEVFDFCQRFGVDYLIRNTINFTPNYLNQEEFFFQPYNDLIVEMVASRSNFVLPRLQPVYTSGSFAVISCSAEIVFAAK